MPRSVHDSGSNVGGKLPRVRGDVLEESNPSSSPPGGGRTGSTNFDYVDHVSDSVDVLPSTRGAEIVQGTHSRVPPEDIDVQEDPSDLR